jgi:hypothetical protein
MSFVSNNLALFGPLLIGIPIVLHLIMRQKPKLMEFPALRFIQRRHETNQRRLRLRHILLLSLRALLIALLALAFARPRVVPMELNFYPVGNSFYIVIGIGVAMMIISMFIPPRWLGLSQRQPVALVVVRTLIVLLLMLVMLRPTLEKNDKGTGSLGGQESPVAAVLIFDTAPHMQYRFENKTRLEAAREMGNKLLSQLPPDSQIAVFDTGKYPRTFDADRGLSKQRIDRLEIVPASQTLSRVACEAVRVLAKSELPRKEIYVFSDLSQAAWQHDDAATLQDRLHELAGVGVYIIDVGIADPKDFTLGDLSLSRQLVAAGGSLQLRTDLASIGAAGQRVVELEVTDPDGKKQKMDERTVELAAGESKAVEFAVSGLKTGVYQGRVFIDGQDALPDDNVRYFTVAVRPPWPVLIVAPSPAYEHSVYLTAAIAPPEMRKRNQASYECDVIEYGQLPTTKFDKYAAVCLLDPPPCNETSWQRLTDFASSGHGVGVFLGREAQPVDTFNSPAAQQLLPGKLGVQVPRPDGDLHLSPQNFQHPILNAFASRATATPWAAFPIYRYWYLENLQPGAGAVIDYNDGRPALVERPIQRGRTLTMTTPISDRARRDAWNVLPVGIGKPWPFLILANQMMSYLVGSNEQTLNYLSGQSVLLHCDADSERQTFRLTAPDNVKTLLPPAEKNELAVTSAEQPGNYQVDVGSETASRLGFSVNLPLALTRLDRTTPEQLKEIFGPYKPQLAHSADQIERVVTPGRVGVEIFPYVMMLIALILAAEYIVSNRFYSERKL